MQYKAISSFFIFLHSNRLLPNIYSMYHESGETILQILQTSCFQNFFLEMLRCFLGPPSPWLCNAGSNSSVTRRRMPSSGSALKTTLQRWPTFAHLGVPFDKELMNWFFVWQGYELGRDLKWSGHWWIQSPFASFSHAFFANSWTWCLIL